MHTLTHLITNFLTRFPLLGGVIGLVSAAMFGYLGVTSWQELQTMPEEPLRLSLAEAVAAVHSGQEPWVKIERLTWDCDNFVKEGDQFAVIFTDEERSLLGLATISTSRALNLTCSGLGSANVTGVLRLMGDGVYERLDDRGFDLSSYGGATAQVNLCTTCGPSNSRFGVILAAIMVPIGLLMYPLLLYLKRHPTP